MKQTYYSRRPGMRTVSPIRTTTQLPALNLMVRGVSQTRQRPRPQFSPQLLEQLYQAIQPVKATERAVDVRFHYLQ